MVVNSRVAFGIGMAALLVMTGCSGGNGTETATVRVAFQVKGPGSAFQAADACGNTLTSAKLVVRELELDRVEDDEEPEDVEVGPFLIEIAGADFNGMLQQELMTATLPVGTYDEAELEIHKLDDSDPNDVAAAQANPALQEMLDANLSIRILGTTSSGAALVFESSLNEEQEKAVNVVVGDTTTGIDGITFSIDPSAWFTDPSDGSCLDPNDPSNKWEIESRIKDSIGLDEDDDGDGIDDENDPDS